MSFCGNCANAAHVAISSDTTLPSDRSETEEITGEIKRLKSCINNLISVRALPAIWSGGKPSRIVSASLDMVPKMLSLDFAYARLKDSTGETSLEIARLAQD
jgi:hypothetical protein